MEAEAHAFARLLVFGALDRVVACVLAPLLLVGWEVVEWFGGGGPFVNVQCGLEAGGGGATGQPYRKRTRVLVVARTVGHRGVVVVAVRFALPLGQWT